LSPNPATDITLKSRAGTPFDTPELSAAEAVADINVTNFTIKARLDAIQNGQDHASYTRWLTIRGLRRAQTVSFVEFLAMLAGTLSFSTASITGERFCLSTSCPRESLRKISRGR
jgi:hypothetical protein